MNPDRIVVGECRGPETMALLWSLATGHSGMTSIHGNSAEHAVKNLIRFALTSGARIESEQALDWVQEVDIVVHCDRPRSPHGEGRNFQPRHIDEITEVAGAEGNRATLNPLFHGAGPDLEMARRPPTLHTRPHRRRLRTTHMNQARPLTYVVALAMSLAALTGSANARTATARTSTTIAARPTVAQLRAGANVTALRANNAVSVECSLDKPDSVGRSRVNPYPALTALQATAAQREKQSVRVRMPIHDTYLIISIRFNKTRTTATAVARADPEGRSLAPERQAPWPRSRSQ